MSEIEWEEVKGATWADIREGWKYDWVDLVDQHTFWGAKATDDDYGVMDTEPAVLLRAWKPVEKPKPTVAFVEHWVKRPAFLHEDHYYDARSGEFLASVNSGKVEVICEGVVVPAAELEKMWREVKSGAITNRATIDFLERCKGLGVFGNE